ncbi:MAG: SUMF1/EgtB/PvdO family nonheme iron enzyme [Deltaproteobacteria bacterium]|nr:SUMF1/EgtB/PvdO family nonheme iron enzyme [Deltaproteobacteria bacterium]
MYAAVERAIRFSRRFSYIGIAVAVVGACEVSHQEPSIEPEPANVGVAPVAVDNAETQGGIPTAREDQIPGARAADVSPAASACPAGMILVEGSYCPSVEQPCAEWKDDPAQTQFARCQRFAEPSTCKTTHRETMRYCIDKYEAADDTGMPVADVSWTQAAAACKASGKRLCKEQEWVFACEGEKMNPYPYGFVRDPSVCHFEISEGLATKTGDLADKRQPVLSNPQCVSTFGVQNMVGNIDEWVVLDKPHWSQANGGRKMMSGLKGGWWGPLRNRCRPTTVDHDEFFHELQTGYRCCADAS